jgi:hypothetical protein
MPTSAKIETYSEDRCEARQMIFAVAKDARSNAYVDRKLIDAYLETVGLYQEAVENTERGDREGGNKAFRMIHRRLALLHDEMQSQHESIPESRIVWNVYIAIGFIFAVAALLIFIMALYVASIGTISREATVMSFAILVFMVGTTLITWQTSIQRRYMIYMWIAAFVILGTLNGAWVIGTIVRP